MSSERHLACRREDTDSARVAPLRRKDERAFREVELARNLLHLPVRQPIGFRQHGELVARKWTLSEDVAQEKLIGARHPSSPRIRRSRLRESQPRNDSKNTDIVALTGLFRARA